MMLVLAYFLLLVLITVSAVDSQGYCLGTYTYVSSLDSCYKFYTNTEKYSKAVSTCAGDQSGWLVTISGTAENTHVSSFSSNFIWIGYNKEYQSYWAWVHPADSTTYTNWAPGEPGSSRTCSNILEGSTSSSRQWDDSYCGDFTT